MKKIRLKDGKQNNSDWYPTNLFLLVSRFFLRLWRRNPPYISLFFEHIGGKGILSPSPLQAPIEAELRTGQAAGLRRAEVAAATQAGLSNGVNDFVSKFKSLSKDDQKEVMKKLIPEFSQTAMRDKPFMQEMMPQCMEMMKGMDFPMREMMSKMMGNWQK